MSLGKAFLPLLATAAMGVAGVGAAEMRRVTPRRACILSLGLLLHFTGDDGQFDFDVSCCLPVL